MEKDLVRLLINPISNDNERMKELYMLSSRVDLDSTEPPVLILAARHQNTDVVSMLLYNGANINIQDKYGNTALILACIMANFRMVEFLLRNGADPNIAERSGLTPLMYTVQVNEQVGKYDRYMMCMDSLLLSGYTNVDMRDDEGMTALMYACQVNNIRAVNSLLYHRANPFLRNDNGQKAFDLTGDDNIKRLIRSYEEQINVENQRLIMRIKTQSITPSIAKNISSFLSFRSKRRNKKSKSKSKKIKKSKSKSKRRRGKKSK